MIPLLLSLALGLGLCTWLLRHPLHILGRDDPAGLARKQQVRPIPTVGLLVPTLGLLLLGELAAATAVCLALMALLGWVDDSHGYRWPWLLKLGSQIAALALFLFVLAPEALQSPTTSAGLGQSLLLLGVSLLILTAWNLYDNFDGALTWMALASLGSLLWIGTGSGMRELLPALLPALAGGLLGFLFFNWPRARLYLGDAGSQVTGFALLLLTLTLASAAATGTGSESGLLELDSRNLVWLVLPHLLPLLDLLQVMLGRLLRGRPPWVGDRRHLAHLVCSWGCPAPLVAPLLALVQLGAALLVHTSWAT